LSTLIYLYVIDEFEVVNKIIEEPIAIIKEPIKQINEKIVQQLPERSKLYEEIMNTVSNIPKPLNFVDNFKFDL
jgi:esterase/lipase